MPSLATLVQQVKIDPVVGADKLPSVDELHAAFRLDYETGLVYWRKPPPRSRVDIAKPAGCSFGHHVYWRIKYKRKAYAVHRIVFKMVNGYEPPEVDHRDGNRLNNRPSNLRAAERHQNRWNIPRTKGRAMPRGVGIEQGRYAVRLMENGRRHFIGAYDTLQEAVVARRKAERTYFGEFAPSHHGDF